jgi:tetratricopeptide (TPR) repeat protein
MQVLGDVQAARSTLLEMVALSLVNPGQLPCSDRDNIRPDFDLRLASAYHDLGTVHRQLGELPLAVEHLSASIDLKTSILGEFSASVADSLSNLSLALKLAGKEEEAMVMNRKAMRIFHERDQRGHVGY